ncbi:MAG: enoyl-CoA hydratase, partial [Shewanella sp.]
ALPIERELFVGLFDTEDQAEGVNAFLEKRKAEWKNR